MKHLVPLLPGQYYHIYSRGNNGETLFREERNYSYFLKLYAKYIEPVAETYAYCLLRNHFHFLVRIKDCRSYTPSHAFAVLFSTYTKAINRAYERTGSLFEKPFRRKLVDNDRYLACLVAYIHRNPQKHGFVDDFRDWPYTSYHAVLSTKSTRVRRETVLGWFEGLDGFREIHLLGRDDPVIEPLVVDDWT